MSDIPEERLCCGCLFCRVGCEQRIVSDLIEQDSDIEAVAPIKLQYRGREQKIERMILFPGYVFVRARSDCNLFRKIRHQYVYRILCDSEHDWRLHGSDETMVRRLFEIGGVVDRSGAYYENDRLRIVNGFLKDYEGDIVRVDRRMRTAQIRVRLLERETKLWLGYELLDAPTARIPDQSG